MNLADLIALHPVGCKQCGGTDVLPMSEGRYQCRYCSATLTRPQRPEPQVVAQTSPDVPPEPVLNKVTTDALLGVTLRGKGSSAYDARDIAGFVDHRGPKSLTTRKPISPAITIGAVFDHAPVRVMYAVFTEVRAYEEFTEPRYGRSPDDSPLPPLWKTPPVGADEPTRVEHEVHAEEHIAVCHACHGQGRSRCFRCDGTGWDDCSWCRDGMDDGKRCDHCDGRGRERCSPCDGTGMERCTVCAGEGELLHRHRLVQEHKALHEVGAVGEGRDWSEHRWMADADGELLFDEVVPGLMEVLDGDHAIAALAKDIVSRHNAEVRKTGFAFWSRLTVTRVPVTEASYKLGKRDGTIHVYGRSRKVSMKGPKPSGCGCISMGAAAALPAAAALAWVLMA